MEFEASSKPRVIGPCTGVACGHCRYLTETLKELKKKPVTGSIPFEDIETTENLKRVLALHKQGRNL
jgi:formate hydrogenlyase subunit 6/NADH:ubiquinone oxidoreductase subunit I